MPSEAKHTALPPTHGRDKELAAIRELLGRVQVRGGALLIRGEPGIGKTALLDMVAGENELTVLTAGGVPSESTMAFAGLSQLLRPLVGRIPELPDPQRDALSSAFGMSNTPAPTVFLVGLAALDLLADTASRSPLLLVVDDAHWLDAATCEVLAFIARRIEMEPIVLLISARTGVQCRLDEANLPELRLERLSKTSAGAILKSQSPELTPQMHGWVLDTAAGNPLALVELPRCLDADATHVRIDVATLPITERLQRAFSIGAFAFPAVTQTFLLVSALDTHGDLRAILDAVARIEGRVVTLGDLAPAEDAGLVVTTTDALEFRHPLVRAVISQAATASARQNAHAALAKAHEADPDRSVWHRAAALDGEGEDVSTDMEAAAAKALRRGAPHIAAAAFERAARLTADPAKRGALLLRVAEMELELGHPDLSVRLLAEANPLALREQERTRLSLLAQMLDDDSWSGELRIASFLEITDQMMVNGDHELAMETLLTIALRCWWGNPDQRTRDAVVGAAERIQCDMNTPSLLAVLGLADPVGRGALVADRISRMTPDLSDPVGMLMVGRACTAVWAFDLSLPFLDAAVQGLRTQDRLGLLAQALVTQAWAAAHCAREPLAVAAAEEGHRLSTETGQARWMAAAQLAKAMVAAERGDSSAAEALATEAEALLMSMGASSMLALAQFVRGRGAVAHQRYSDGLDHHERILDPTDPAYHPFIGAWALSDLVEAAAHSGKMKLAQDHLEQLESLAAATSGSLLRAEAGYARPMVADDDHAEALFQGALEHDLVGWPCHRGRMLLWYGRWLRRRRRVADSRAPLRAAREGFDALSLPVFAERARQELRASGETTERPVPQPWAPWGGKPGPPGPLTPQELQIARMAADGLSNREIGERLYLSHRTVGSHLYRMFPKLGVTSRSQLRSALDLVIADAP